MITPQEPQTTRAEMHILGQELVPTFNKLIHEGDVRSLTIKHGDHIIMELPQTVGVVGILLTPTLAALGALGALLTDCTVIVERVEEPLVDAYIP